MTDTGNGDIRYSTKELLGRIEAKLDSLAENVRNDINGLGVRVGRIEDHLPSIETLARRIADGEQTVTNLRERMVVHETGDGHPALLARLVAVESKVGTLSTQEAIAEALADARRWTIAQSVALIGLLITMLGLAGKVFGWLH